jgi:hypothetical protein
MTTTEPHRYTVNLYGPNGEKADETFTWAYTLNAAKARVAKMLDDNEDLFEGYSFEVL